MQNLNKLLKHSPLYLQIADHPQAIAPQPTHLSTPPRIDQTLLQVGASPRISLRNISKLRSHTKRKQINANLHIATTPTTAHPPIPTPLPITMAHHTINNNNHTNSTRIHTSTRLLHNLMARAHHPQTYLSALRTIPRAHPRPHRPPTPPTSTLFSCAPTPHNPARSPPPNSPPPSSTPTTPPSTPTPSHSCCACSLLPLTRTMFPTTNSSTYGASSPRGANFLSASTKIVAAGSASPSSAMRWSRLGID